jgi:hypothetical protein
MGGTIRLIQLARGVERRVALVDEPRVRLLRDCDSVYALAHIALSAGVGLTALIQRHVTAEAIDYGAIYDGRSDWTLLTPLDHPHEPARLLVSGTGLTHLGSASHRQTMHETNDEDLTDSMKMYRWGVDGGRPVAGTIGIPPEWFYKGDGTILRAHGAPLIVPPYGEDGGEEAEIAGLYIVAPNGQPRRVGMCIGNEFSDHRFEKKNYLNLAGSKIRTCSLGPELIIDPDFSSVSGAVTIERNGRSVWSKDIRTGDAEMSHSLQNMEHHHFKYASHRRPGDAHVHYYGACSISYGDGFELADKDVMQVAFAGFGRALRNPLFVDKTPDTFVPVRDLA